MKILIPFFAIATSVHADLSNPRGIWQFDGGFEGTLPSYTALDASTLMAGTDYSFSSQDGYQFLQTQPFSSPAKRLTVNNPTGPNGGPGATRTNQWTVVMDVKFDALQPYAGVLQLNPANNADVTIYLLSANNLTASFNNSLSTSGAIAVNTWYRLAITCGNNSPGPGTTMKLYINGVPNGTPRASTFDGPLSLQSTFHLFSDDSASPEVKPAKLGSFGLWGEELSAGDIASLGGPMPGGLASPALPSTIADASPFVYGANIGWIQAKPPENGVVIGEYISSGFAYSANCGWINFGSGAPTNGIRYSNTNGSDSGVNHDGLGNLSGLAWGANIGWMNFGTDSNGTPRATSDADRPRFDLLTGEFAGYAYGANIGWINLSTLKVATLYSPDTDGDSIADAWEHENFLNLTTASATTDTDHDGISDKDEYLADTNPNDSNSILKITHHAIAFFPNDGYNTWDVTFTSSPRRLYRLETSPNLATSSWYGETGLFPGSSSTTTSTDIAVQPAEKKFLRVAAAIPLQP